jgi:RNA polymerase sigma factor (sigma-70 family)
LVLAAGGVGGGDARAALEDLCSAYWHPLYAFARRQGQEPEPAQDAVQSFFAELLAREAISKADPKRGRFRSFLLASFKHSMANTARRERAQKRGGGLTFVALDLEQGERRLALEPSHASTPERAFERTWALTLLREVLGELRRGYVARGTAAHFDALKEYLTPGESTLSYAAKAESLGMREGAVKVAVHRLRRRYADALRSAISDTLEADAGENAEDELQSLLASLKPL